MRNSIGTIVPALRCKDGDIAIIIKDEPLCEKNIGIIVQVRGPAQKNDECGLICWLIQPFNKKKLLKVSYPSGEIKLERATWKSGIEHPDIWLLPIKPSGEDLDISEPDIIKIDNAIELKI